MAEDYRKVAQLTGLTRKCVREYYSELKLYSLTTSQAAWRINEAERQRRTPALKKRTELSK